jgi:hypothetical protein
MYGVRSLFDNLAFEQCVSLLCADTCHTLFEPVYVIAIKVKWLSMVKMHHH